MYGVSFLIPSIVVVAVGRNRLFNYVARRFDRDSERAVQDGAFIAELLTLENLEQGQAWWVHREVGQKNLNYAEADHRHNWRHGCVVEMHATSFVVELSAEKRPSQRKGIVGTVPAVRY